METKFQTSFIPKKPLPSTGGVSMGLGGAISSPKRPPHRPNSLFLSFATLLFIVSLAAAGGMYGWKSVMLSQQASLQKQLADREKQFNPDLIEELKRVNIKIDLARQLMTNHLALSNIFDIIGRFTVNRVRFTSLDLTTPTQQSGDIKLTMRGYGSGFSAVAYQSDVLGQLEQYGLRKIVKNPIISGPALGDSGLVSFDFSASIDPASLNYFGNPPGSTPAINGQSSDTQTP